MQAYLRGLEAVHNGWRVGAPGYSNSHPLVRAHPATGEPSLYLNRTYANDIAGVPWRESRAILDMLFAFCEQPRFACRWRWQPGDVVVWDNSCTIHVASDDYPADVQRDMLHINITGDVPAAY
jgi:taurine dioxygenase